MNIFSDRAVDRQREAIIVAAADRIRRNLQLVVLQTIYSQLTSQLRAALGEKKSEVVEHLLYQLQLIENQINEIQQ